MRKLRLGMFATNVNFLLCSVGNNYWSEKNRSSYKLLNHGTREIAAKLTAEELFFPP